MGDSRAGFEDWMREIPGGGSWTAVSEIPYGWSGERKFCARTANGEAFLLRVSDGSRYSDMRRVHEAMLPVNALGLNASRAIDCGITRDGARSWALLSYIEGESAEKLVPSLPETEQYALGLEAGRMLKKLHSLPAPKNQPEWESRFNAKIDRKRELYRQSGIRMPGDERLIAYIDDNRSLLTGRPQSFQHGDYHIGNMVLNGGILGLVDFNRLDYGDPYEEFNRIVWCAHTAPEFARGRVDGYFDEKPVPPEFFALMAVYIANNTLSSLPWAVSFGEGEMRVMKEQYGEIMIWYDGFRSAVPKWYKR